MFIYFLYTGDDLEYTLIIPPFFFFLIKTQMFSFTAKKLPTPYADVKKSLTENKSKSNDVTWYGGLLQVYATCMLVLEFTRSTSVGPHRMPT